MAALSTQSRHPQHITPRYTAEEITQSVHAIEDRVRLLEQENADLRSQIAARDAI